jgi:transcription elongation factor Elf1
MEAQFSLLLDTRRDVTELTAECAICGAITTQAIDVAWRVGFVMCSECGIQSKFTVSTLMHLRAQAVTVQSVIDRLIRAE